MNNNATNHTQYFNFPLFTGTDKPSVLTDWNGTMEELDTTLEDYRVRISGCEQTTQSFMDRLVVLKNQFDELVARVQGDENIIEDQGLEIEGLQNALLETNESIKRILTDMGTFRTDIETMETLVNNCVTTVGTLTSQVNTLSSNVQSLNADFQSMDATIGHMDESIATMNGRVNNMQNTVDGFSGRISQAETNISNANTRITGVRNLTNTNVGENGLYASFVKYVGYGAFDNEFPYKISFYIDQLVFNGVDITRHSSHPNDDLERYYIDLNVKVKHNSTVYKQFVLPLIFTKNDIQEVTNIASYVNIDKFTPFFDVLSGRTKEDIIHDLGELGASGVGLSIELNAAGSLLGFVDDALGVEIFNHELEKGLMIHPDSTQIRGALVYESLPNQA